MHPRLTHEAILPLAEMQLIDAACDRFEAEWKRGGRPDLGAYLLELDGALRAPLFRELLNLELDFRSDDDDVPDPLPVP